MPSFPRAPLCPPQPWRSSPSPPRVPELPGVLLLPGEEAKGVRRWKGGAFPSQGLVFLFGMKSLQKPVIGWNFVPWPSPWGRGRRELGYCSFTVCGREGQGKEVSGGW